MCLIANGIYSGDRHRNLIEGARPAVETVLIVEDDPSIRLGLQKNLKFEGYDVLTASDGERGLQLAIDRPPDLIILDIMLPKISGFDICKTLKKNNIKKR